jgi:hypothetical protein
MAVYKCGSAFRISLDVCLLLTQIINSYVHRGTKYSTYSKELQYSCHLLAPARKCMTHHQVLKDFPDINQVSFHRNTTIKLIIL